MRPAVRGLLLAGALALLGVAGLAAYVGLSFDINDHRHRLTAEIERLTGRPLAIEGEIGLSLFPWLGIEASALSLGNLPQFGPAPLARIERIEARARLLPMLRGELEIDRILIEGLALALVRTQDGEANWATPAAHRNAPVSPAAGANARPPAQDGPGLTGRALAIGRLELRSARIDYTDLQAGTHHVIEALDFSSAAIRAGASFPLQLAFRADSGRSDAGAERIQAELSLRGEARLDADAHTLTLSELGIESRISGASIPGGVLAPTIQGRASIALGTGAVTIDDLVLAVDQTRLTGLIALTDPGAPALRFDLQADRIDLDRYLSAQGAPAASSPGIAAAAGGQAPAAAAQGPRTADTLVADGRLRIDTLRASGLTISALDATLRAAEGVVRLEPLRAQLYGGRYEGRIALDTRRQPARLSLDETLSDVELAPLLKDLTGAAPRVTGRGDLRARLQADAGAAEVVKRSLDGRIELRVRDGAVSGVNVAEMMREASARLRGATAPAAGASQTDFTELSATLLAAGGVLRNDDFAMRSPLLRASGAGSANLIGETIDYRLRTSVVATLAGQGGDDLGNLRGVTVPIRITGSFAQPVFALDLDALIADTVRNRARERLEEKLRGTLPLPEQLPDRLREGLGNFLR